MNAVVDINDRVIKYAFDFFIHNAQFDFEVNPPIVITTDLSDKNEIKEASVNVYVDLYFYNSKNDELLNNHNIRYVCWLSLLTLKFKRETIINFLKEDIKTKIINNVALMMVCLTDRDSFVKCHYLDRLNKNKDYQKLINNLIEKFKIELSKKYFYEEK